MAIYTVIMCVGVCVIDSVEIDLLKQEQDKLKDSKKVSNL